MVTCVPSVRRGLLAVGVGTSSHNSSSSASRSNSAASLASSSIGTRLMSSPPPHAESRATSDNRPFYHYPPHHHCLSRSSSSTWMALKMPSRSSSQKMPTLSTRPERGSRPTIIHVALPSRLFRRYRGRLAQIASTSSGRTLRIASLSTLALSQSNPSAEDGWRTLSPTASCLTLCDTSASQYTRRQSAAHNVHARGTCRGRERKALRHRRLLELHRRPSVPCRASSFHRRCIPACPVASHQSAALAPSRPHRRERTVSASRTNARAL